MITTTEAPRAAPPVCALVIAAVAAAVTSGGCGSEPGAARDAAPVDAPRCVPFSGCDWLDGYQRRIVGALAGATEIAPGVTLAHRASETERTLAREYLVDELTALGLAVAQHDYGSGANVVASLDATTGSGELIIVGAHFDGVPAGPAAADNATGVAIVLAAARYLRDLPVRTHPIVFVLFDEEELGLIGSRAYAQSVAATGKDLAGVHVFDMLSFDGDGDRAVELWSPTPALAALYEQHGAAVGIPVGAVTFDRSDHQAFLDLDMPAVGVGEEFVGGDHTPHYHRATDTYDRVSFEHLATVTQLAFSVLETSATAP